MWSVLAFKRNTVSFGDRLEFLPASLVLTGCKDSKKLFSRSGGARLALNKMSLFHIFSSLLIH